MNTRKILPMAGFLLLFSVDYNMAKADEKAKQSFEKTALESFSISRSKDYEKMQMRLRKSNSLGAKTQQSHGTPAYEQLYLMCKPNDRNRKIVAVLAVSNGGRPTLNPRFLDFEYGPIPILNKMSLEMANKLWGTTKVESKNLDTDKVETTYELVSNNMNDRHISSKSFKLDAVFTKNELDKFRIRSASINNDWCDLTQN